MGRWWNFFRIFKRDGEAVDDGPRVAPPRPAPALRFYPVSGGAAMSVAAIYRCVQLLSDGVAGFRLQYLKRRGGLYAEDENDPLHYLLTVQPQPEMSVFDFWSMAVRQMLLDGNAYIYPRRVLGEVTDLVLCARGSVAHDALNGVYAIADGRNGVYGTFGEGEIIHLYLHSSDGRTGESVIAHARRTVGIASAGDEETANRFANGGNVRGIVTNDKTALGFGEYQDEELSRAARGIDERFSSGEHIVSLPGQVDFKQITMNSADMQFLESRKFTVREICRFFGVNPAFVFDDAGGNYKSAEMAGTVFLSMTLDPILKRIEAEFCRKLIPRGMCCSRVFRFDRRGLYSLDLQSRADYQRKTIESGIYTVNDWRRIENQPEVKGGDTVYVSANLTPLGDKDNNNNNKTNG